MQYIGGKKQVVWWDQTTAVKETSLPIIGENCPSDTFACDHIVQFHLETKAGR